MKKIMSFIITAVLLMTVLPIQAIAENAYQYSVDLEGECYYDYAGEMLGYINEHRTELGLSELALDHELTEAAMKRALEIAVNFEHVRPDGSSCFTICSKMNAENIAVGRSTAKDTYEQFKASAAHYKKMINSAYRSIGIGAVYHNGHFYWVQLFSMTPTNMMEDTEGIVPLKHTVKVAEEDNNLTLYTGNYISSSKALEMPVGKSYQMTVERFNPGYVYFTSSIAASSFLWQSSDPSVISVDENGLITAVGVGTASVTVSVIDGNITMTQSYSVPGSMSDVEAEEIPDVIYNGFAAEPDPVLTLKGSRLVKDKDYTLTYSDNESVGTAKVTVTGIGFVKGTLELSFNILPPDISDESITDIQLPESLTYTGSSLTPEPVIMFNGRKLVKDVDYTLSYSSNDTVGTAYVTVEGCGIYSGTKTVAFEIKPVEAAQGLTSKINANAVYSEESYPDRQSFVEANVQLSYKGTPLVSGQDYNITYSSLTSEKKLASLKIQFTGVYTGSYEFSTLSSAFVPAINDCYYNGGEIVPDITVYKNELDRYYGGTPLTADVDYYLYFTENQYPGTAEVTIIGIGKYFGEATAHFKIKLVQKGDVDRDGSINMRDITTLQRALNGWECDFDRYAADVDHDGEVNMRDITTLQRYLNGWDVKISVDDPDDSSSESDTDSSNTDSDSSSESDTDSSNTDTDSSSNTDSDSSSESDTDSSNTDTDSSNTDTDSSSNTDTDSGSNTDTDSGSNTETDSSNTDTDSSSNTDTDSGSNTDTDSGSNTDTDSGSNTETDSGSNTDTDSSSKTDIVDVA